MSDTSNLISDLNAKVEELIGKYADAKSTVRKQKDEIEELNKKLAEKEAVVANLENELKNAAAKPVVENSGGSEQLKLRINELVREIDNCISLLKV